MTNEELKQPVAAIAPLIIAFITLIFGALRTISSSAVWQHLASGAEGIVKSAPFGFDGEPSAVVNLSWLYDRLLSMVWNMGGPVLVTLLTLAGLLCAFYLMQASVSDRCGPAARGFSMLLSVWVLMPLLGPGPVTSSLIFSSVYIYLLEKNKNFILQLSLLLPMQLLWANMHSAFLIGPVIALLYMLASILATRRGEAAPVKQRAILFAAALLLCFCTPFGFGGVIASFQQTTMPYVNQEWISAFSSQFATVGSKHWITIMIIIAAAGLVSCTDRLSLPLTTLAAFSSALILLVSIEWLPYFALLSLPFVAIALSSTTTLVVTSLKQLGPVEKYLTYLPASLAAIALLAALVMIPTNKYYTSGGYACSFGLGLAQDTTPAQLIDTMGASFPEKCITTPAYGSYLRWAKTGPVFCDRMNGAENRKNLQDLFATLDRDPQDLQAYLETCGAEALLLNPQLTTSSAMIFRMKSVPGWRTVYMDGTSILMVAPGFSLQDQAKLQEAGLDYLGARLDEYKAATDQGQRVANPGSLIGAAKVFIEAGDIAKAAMIYEPLTKGTPNMKTAWLNGGLCAMALNDVPKAVKMMERAVLLDDKNASAWLQYSRALRADKRNQSADAAFKRVEHLDPEMAMAAKEEK